MEKGFFDLLLESLKSSLNAVVGIASLLVSVLLWGYAPRTQVPLGLIVPVTIFVVVILLVVCITAFDAAYKANKEANEARQARDEARRDHERVRAEYESYRADGGGKLPQIIEGMDPFEGTRDALVCLLERSELYSRELTISFYSISTRGLEVLVGVGSVTNVQFDGKIQASMHQVVEGHENFADRLRRNDREARMSTRVKPGIPITYTGFLPQGDEE